MILYIENFYSLQNIKLQNGSKEQRINSPSPTNKFLVGYRIKSPGYSVYYQRQKKQVILPPINPRRQQAFDDKNKKDVIEEKSEEGMSNEGSRSGSGSVSESGSGEGSGSGSGDE